MNENSDAAPSPSSAQKLLNHPAFAILFPAVAGFALAAFSILLFHDYGSSLFLGLPVVISFLSSFCTSFRRSVPTRLAYGRALLSLLTLGGFVLLFALDGLFCLILAFPLAAALAIIGTVLGQLAGSSFRGPYFPVALLPFLLIPLFPALVAFDWAIRPEVPLRRVTTSVVVQAPIRKVWQGVVAFPPIAEPPEGIFRLGVAYPLEARIDGHGVGATRYCVFSTGSFVEPVIIWHEPELLAFKVTSSPPPMKEFSIYPDLKAPHLHDHMVSRRGQFKLVECREGVILEGTTWYTHCLYPQWYWGPISDLMIHCIHRRVLNHIRRTVE